MSMKNDDNPAKKTIHVFALASFLNDFGSDMIYPIWPLFVTTVLKANMEVLGFIDGLGDAIVSLSQALSGYYSDRLKKRKVFIWAGYLCGFFSRIGYAFTSAWPQLIPFRVLDRAGKMRGAPRDAFIADVSTIENRGSHFGLLRMADNLGAVCGILFTIFLFKYLGYRKLFILAAFPTAIGIILILSQIKETHPIGSRIFKGFTFKHLDVNFLLFMSLSAVFSLGVFSYSFLLIYAKQFGFQVSTLPVLYLVFTIFASLSSLPFGRLADRVGRKPVVLFSFILWGLVCLTLMVSQTLWAAIITFIFYGLHKGAIETAQKAFVSELAPAEYRASGLGTFQMVTGVCALPANLLAGFLWEQVGLFSPLFISLTLTLLAAALLIFVKENRA
jgi:MFS family permease